MVTPETLKGMVETALQFGLLANVIPNVLFVFPVIEVVPLSNWFGHPNVAATILTEFTPVFKLPLGIFPDVLKPVPVIAEPNKVLLFTTG